MTSRALGLVLAWCLLIGQALGQTPPTRAADDAAPPPTETSANDYRIGPGDTLQIFVWRNPELTVTVPVRPDGKISTPLVSDMDAVGKTPSQLAKDLEGVLAEYVRSPKVNVIVSNATSLFSQVKVVGQVSKPQSVAFREGLTVMDVMLQVGDGKQTEIKVKLVDLLNKGDMKQNQVLKPGDVIVVPQSRF
jgi:polysaccharide export outer membrane protein